MRCPRTACSRNIFVVLVGSALVAVLTFAFYNADTNDLSNHFGNNDVQHLFQQISSSLIEPSTILCLPTFAPTTINKSETSLIAKSTNVVTILGRETEAVVINDSLLAQIHFSVKTTHNNLDDKLRLLILTWLQTVPHSNLKIITDKWNEDKLYYGVQLYNAADCPTGHNHKSLACKSGIEYELYYAAVDRGKSYKWFCHFDDDMYLNVVSLLKLLHNCSHGNHWYLGRSSVNRRHKIPIHQSISKKFPKLMRKEFYFGTGAAYCISAVLMNEIKQYLRGADKFMRMSKLLGYPDDMIVGFVIEALLGYKMTNIISIHTHLHPLRRIKIAGDEITISYIKRNERDNIINLPQRTSTFSEKEDPTRFLSYHCMLYYRHTSWCTRSNQTTVLH